MSDLGPACMRKSCLGDPGHPPPQGKLTARLHGKRLPRVAESKLGSRLGDCEESQKNVRPSFHSCCWLVRIVRHVALSRGKTAYALCIPSWPFYPSQCVFTWKKVGPAPRVTVPGTTFSHINRAYEGLIWETIPQISNLKEEPQNVPVSILWICTTDNKPEQIQLKNISMILPNSGLE